MFKMAKKKVEENKYKYNYEVDKRLKFCPEPTYVFNIGDKVTIGLLRDIVVIGVFEDNKVYEIEYSYEKNDYGKKEIVSGEKRFVLWYDIRKSHNNQTPTLIRNQDIHLQYSQMTISSLLNKIYFFGVDFEPEYQRDYVWEDEDKVNLIDSIFHNLDIGKFAFVKTEMKEHRYEVLDGKQRLNAIKEYFEDKFPYKGKYFSDLSIREQDFFEDKSIAVAEVDTSDRKTILHYFLMLNRTGKTMGEKDLKKVEEMLANM